MHKRKITKEIERWIRNGKTPLLIDWARQVGKTTTIREALKHENFVEFNLVENNEFLVSLNDINNNSAEEILTLFKLHSNKKLEVGKTIVFIDEIQECKELITKVKFLAQELNSHGYNCYYYNSKKYGELDFVIETDGALPIEVESGASYTKHSALNNVMSNKSYNINKAIVFSNENVSHAKVSTLYKEKNDFKIKEAYMVIYLPMYMTMFIDESKIDLNKPLL